jgi:hypothetical protein
MVFDYQKYVSTFKKQPTKKLISGYKRYNSDFRRIARQELARRKVGKKSLPYKSPTRRTSSVMSYGSGSIW